MAGWSKPDTLAQMIGKRLNLEEILGPDIYSVLESGKVKTEMLGFESSIDLLKKQANIRKKFGEKSRIDFNIKPKTKEWKLGYSWDID
jgi:hypothetical protein